MLRLILYAQTVSSLLLLIIPAFLHCFCHLSFDFSLFNYGLHLCFSTVCCHASVFPFPWLHTFIPFDSHMCGSSFEFYLAFAVSLSKHLAVGMDVKETPYLCSPCRAVWIVQQGEELSKAVLFSDLLSDRLSIHNFLFPSSSFSQQGLGASCVGWSPWRPFKLTH